MIETDSPMACRRRLRTLRGRACLSAALAALAAQTTSPAMAQSGPPASVSTNAEAHAILLRPFVFFAVDDMHFGDIVPGPQAGTVRLHPDGRRTTTGPVVAVGSRHQPARFAGLGISGRMVNIALGTNSFVLTGPGAAMRVSSIEIGSSPTAILSTSRQQFRITSPTGAFNFPLGGTLAVGRNQAPGVYRGSYTITLTYQ